MAQLRPGDVVEYLRSGVFDQLIVRGDRGTVTRVEDGWVFADWESGQLSVPIAAVRLVGEQDHNGSIE